MLERLAFLSWVYLTGEGLMNMLLLSFSRRLVRRFWRPDGRSPRRAGGRLPLSNVALDELAKSVARVCRSSEVAHMAHGR